jgi:hypothetical protein
MADFSRTPGHFPDTVEGKMICIIRIIEQPERLETIQRWFEIVIPIKRLMLEELSAQFSTTIGSMRQQGSCFLDQPVANNCPPKQQS